MMTLRLNCRNQRAEPQAGRARAQILVLGANAAAEQPDFAGRVEALLGMRPGLDIAWRPSDAGAAPASDGGTAFG
jgi:hypothetical protein